jgi:hypothetical protein
MKSRIIKTIIFLFTGIFLFSVSIGWMNKNKGIGNEIIREAVRKSIPILQTSSNTFIVKKQCATCHHSLLTSMVVELAKQKGVPVEDSFAAKRIIACEGNLQFVCNPNIIRDFLNIKLIIPYGLMGLAAEKTRPDFRTDMAVAFLISEVNPDGSFPGEYLRVPLEVGQIHSTSLSIHAIQLYVAPSLKQKADQMVVKTKTWLEHKKPFSQQELAYQLLGLHWCGSNDEVKKEVIGKIMDLQRADGGWAQLPSMNSDAYATGETLYALYTSGMIQAGDEKYQKALNYLLKTQEPDGSWFVQARSFIIQPFVNSNFPPNDENQFISAAATNWATIALLEVLPDKKN